MQSFRNLRSKNRLRQACAETLESRQLLSGGTGSLIGIIFNDQNANGAFDTGDTRVAGVTVYLDLNHTGTLDPGDPSATTDTLGWYVFSNLAPGNYTISYLMPAGFHAAHYQPTSQTVSLAAGDSPITDFGISAANGSITGTVVDASGQPLPDFGVYMDLNGNGKIDPGEPYTWTDANGHFGFSGLLAGTYVVRVDPLHYNYTQLAPSAGSYTLFSDGINASPPLSFQFEQNPPPAQFQVNQLVDYVLIGGSGADAANRFVGPGVSSGGWAGFVANTVLPDIAWGARRIEMHNPFGINTAQYQGASYSADQYLEAQAAGLTWLTNGFVDAWKPITASGVEVIAYIGNPELDPSFAALQNDPVAWNARFQACVAPLVQAGMSICFDCGQRTVQGDLLDQAAQQLRAQGVKVYLEGRPPENQGYRFSWPTVTSDFQWINSNPYGYPSQWWDAKNGELPPGNSLRIISTDAWSLPAPQLLAAVQGIMENEDVADVPVWVLRQDSITLSQVLTPPGSSSPTLTTVTVPVPTQDPAVRALVGSVSVQVGPNVPVPPTTGWNPISMPTAGSASGGASKNSTTPMASKHHAPKPAPRRHVATTVHKHGTVPATSPRAVLLKTTVAATSDSSTAPIQIGTAMLWVTP